MIGLTGQTGAGKSVISNGLKDYGFYPIDCDRLARAAVEKGSDTLEQLCSTFGEDILSEDGSLNRKKLGSIVFADPKKLEMLNAITHPAILELLESEILYAAGLGYAGAVVDAPTLFESGADQLCDTVIAVVAKESERLARIMQRDGLTEEAALQRIKAQHPIAFYTERSDAVIENDKEPCDALKQALDFLCDKGYLAEDCR